MKRRRSEPTSPAKVVEAKPGPRVNARAGSKTPFRNMAGRLSPMRARSIVLKRPCARRTRQNRRLSNKRSASVPELVAEDSALPSALVVNLARRSDRWESVSTCFATTKGLSKLSLERFEATDGEREEIPETFVTLEWCTLRNREYVRRVFDEGDDYAVCTLLLSKGERGCAMSHVRAWRRIADGTAPVMVLEDDALPRPTFAPRLRRALTLLHDESPDILYLGYTQAAPWRRSVGPVVREAEYVWTTVGYLLWPLGARKLLEALPVDQPVDNFMSHLIAASKLRGFVVTPAIVRQAKVWNKDSDVPHSDEQAWS